MTDDLAMMTATDLVTHYRRKTLSPVEVTEAVLARTDRCESALNAFCVLDGDFALAAARESEARWHTGAPLGLVDGVPTTIKDVVTAKGWPTRRGSRTSPAEGPWEVDAPAPARLREHGAVLLGKTTTPEYGWKGVTDCPLTGITRNPWNTDLTPGGSSGGAAAACATGMGAPPGINTHFSTSSDGSLAAAEAEVPNGSCGAAPTKSAARAALLESPRQHRGAGQEPPRQLGGQARRR